MKRSPAVISRSFIISSWRKLTPLHTPYQFLSGKIILILYIWISIKDRIHARIRFDLYTQLWNRFVVTTVYALAPLFFAECLNAMCLLLFTECLLWWASLRSVRTLHDQVLYALLSQTLHRCCWSGPSFHLFHTHDRFTADESICPVTNESISLYLDVHSFLSMTIFLGWYFPSLAIWREASPDSIDVRGNPRIPQRKRPMCPYPLWWMLPKGHYIIKQCHFLYLPGTSRYH